MLSKPINLALVDGHALFRKTLKNFLSDQKNINVLIQMQDIADLHRELRSVPVDVLLMDIYFSDVNIIDVVKTIRNEHQGIKILAVSGCSDIGMISDLFDAGINGYVSKSDEPEELLRSIQAVYEDPPCLNRWFAKALRWSKQRSSTAIQLNKREQRILQLIWEEKSNKEIADELFLGVRTVERLRQDLKDRIGARSTVGLIKYAIQNRIINEYLKGQPATLM